MAKKTEKPAKQDPVTEAPTIQEVVTQDAIPAADLASAQAPFLYFEDARTYGHLNGVVRVTLEAGRIYSGPTGQGVRADRVMVAHLRTSVAGARALKAALEGALLLATPAQSQQKN